VADAVAFHRNALQHSLRRKLYGPVFQRDSLLAAHVMR